MGTPTSTLAGLSRPSPPPIPEPPAVRGAWGQLLRVMLDLWPAYVACCSEHDLPPTQGHALLRLLDRQPMIMRDLADLLSLDPSTVTGIVDRMEVRGLVRRVSGPDRRVKLLALTAEGERVRTALLASLARTPGPIARLTAADQQEIGEALGLIGHGPCRTFPR